MAKPGKGTWIFNIAVKPRRCRKMTVLERGASKNKRDLFPLKRTHQRCALWQMRTYTPTDPSCTHAYTRIVLHPCGLNPAIGCQLHTKGIRMLRGDFAVGTHPKWKYQTKDKQASIHKQTHERRLQLRRGHVRWAAHNIVDQFEVNGRRHVVGENNAGWMP